MPTACTIRYVVKGIAERYAPHTSLWLCEEIQEVLPYPGPVSAKPIDEGMEISISVTDIEPFNMEFLLQSVAFED